MFSFLMLKGMWCHRRTLSTAVIHPAPDFSANLRHCSLYTRQLFTLCSFYPTPLLPRYTGCPCYRSLNNEMLFETCTQIVLMVQYQLWSGWAWLDETRPSVSGCIYNSVFCAEAADSRKIQEDNASTKIGESVQTDSYSTSQYYEKLFRFSGVLEMKMLPCFLGGDGIFLLVIKSWSKRIWNEWIHAE